MQLQYSVIKFQYNQYSIKTNVKIGVNLDLCRASFAQLVLI